MFLNGKGTNVAQIIFSQQGYKVLKEGDEYVMETPSGVRHGHPTASAARDDLVKEMKAEGVYGKGSYGNADPTVVKEYDGKFFNAGRMKALNAINEKLGNAPGSTVGSLDTHVLKTMVEQYNKQATRAKLKDAELIELMAVIKELKSRGESV